LGNRIGDLAALVLFLAEQETSKIISLLVPLESGEMVEAALVGSDGIVGASAALDGRMSVSLGVL
jgi:hypothetical protein